MLHRLTNIAATAVAVAATVTAAPTAHAAAPYGGYDEAAQPGVRVVRVHGVPIRPCRYEDSGRLCWWDARSRGNGEGRSFWRGRRGHVHYLTAREARVIRRAVR